MTIDSAGFAAPAALVEHARRFQAEGGTPATPRVAATVLLLRPPTPTSRCTSSAGPPRWPSAGCTPSPAAGWTRSDSEAHLDWAGPTPASGRERLGVAAGRPRRRSSAPPPGRSSRRPACCSPARTRTTVVGDVSGADWEAARQALDGRRARASPTLLAERGLHAARRTCCCRGPVDHAGVRAAPLRHVLLRRPAAGGAADPRRLRRGRPHPVDPPGGRAGPRARPAS